MNDERRRKCFYSASEKKSQKSERGCERREEEVGKWVSMARTTNGKREQAKCTPIYKKKRKKGWIHVSIFGPPSDNILALRMECYLRWQRSSKRRKVEASLTTVCCTCYLSRCVLFSNSRVKFRVERAINIF